MERRRLVDTDTRAPDRRKPMNSMNLGELIDALAECPAEYLRIAEPMPLTPRSVSSYRGYYEDLAIEYVEGYGEKMRLDHFLTTLRSAVGETFEGYKGGEYTMSRDTCVWVSNHGKASSTRVSGVVVDDDTAYLTLTVCWRK